MFRISLCLLLSLTIASFAQTVEFPLGSLVIDVTKDPYNAQGDGKADDTEAIQQALDDHPDGDFIIYLPHGVYKISKQLSWPRADEPEKSYRRTILQGESMGGTILVLEDNCRGFENTETPRAMLYTGVGPVPRYRNAIRDMSLRTGKGNPGAIGIRFNAATQGTILNVKIYSGDGAGVAGIDMGFAENIGPLLVKNVEIKGFDVGIFTRTPFFGMTLEHIYLSGQRKYGIENHDQALTIRNLRSRNAVPAIYNAGEHAMLTLIDGTLEYVPGKIKEKIPAIINEAGLFVRAVSTSKYNQAIEDNSSHGGKGLKGPEIMEYASANTEFLCHTPPSSIKLPVAETMETSQQPAAQWVGMQGDYGGTASDGTDDSKAIQQAIDDGAETIYFSPGGRYTINKDIHVRKRLRHILGTEARIDGTGKFIIEEGTFNEITIERFSAFGNGIKHMSGRTLILKNMSTKSYVSDTLGAGDLYLEDVSINTMTINLQHVWARQLYMNYDNGTKIINNGGILWILGLTAENGNTVLHNRDQGEVEIAGIHVISNAKAKTRPLFINDSANLSIEGLRETAMQGNAFQKIVEETRKGESKILFSDDLEKGPSGGVFLPLYVGYVPKTGVNTSPIPEAPEDMIVILPDKAKLSGQVTDDGRADGLCSVPVEWSKLSGPGKIVFADQRAYNTEASFTFSGRYHVEFSAHDGKMKGIDTVRIFVFDRRTTTQDHNGDNVSSGRGMDTWISEFDSYTPHGSDSLLHIGNAPSNSAKIYLKFDISGLPGPVSDAALQLNVNMENISKPMEWNVFGLLEDPAKPGYGEDKLGVEWQESELTWANAPGNLNLPGGAYIVRQNLGGGIDPRYTKHLGVITVDPKSPFGTFLRNPSLTEFMKRKHKSGLFTLILSAVSLKDTGLVAARDAGKTVAPVLYLSYFDSNKTVGGDVMQGGFQMSKVKIDIYTLACSFDLTLGQPQFVQIEIYNEFGKRIMIIAEQEMESEKAMTFKFNAKTFPTGKYKVKVVGEAFQKEQGFYILN